MVQNDVIQQGANSQNSTIISVGEEGSLHAGSSLLVSGDTIVKILPRMCRSACGIRTAWRPRNRQLGLRPDRGAVDVRSRHRVRHSFLTTRPVLDTSSHWEPTGPTVLGSGPDTRVLEVGEDAWKGDARFTVSIDGKQIGGTQTAVASHAAGQNQAFDVEGAFGPGQHTVAVDFLNDAWAGTASTDRNLYVTGATIDGIAVSGASLSLWSDGPKSFTFQEPTTPAVAVASTTPAEMAFIGGGSAAPASAGSGSVALSPVSGAAPALSKAAASTSFCRDPAWVASLGGAGAGSDLAASVPGTGQALGAGRPDHQVSGGPTLLSAMPPMHDLIGATSPHLLG